jgi:hypothetical protein
MMEALRTSKTSVDKHFTRQYNPEDSSEHHFPLASLSRPASYPMGTEGPSPGIKRGQDVTLRRTHIWYRGQELAGQGLVAGCCECGDKRSGSGVTELVS